MKRIVMFVAVLACVGISSCNKKSVEPDFNAQLAKDVASIDAWLAANNVDAVEDPSGVRYVVQVVGTGLKPILESKISVKYTARILGTTTPFDQSTNGVVLILNQLIKGWQIALPLMNKGSKFTLYVPSGLAYGATGSGSTVPANANVVFDVELLDDDAQLIADVAILDHYLDSIGVDTSNAIFDERGFRYKFTTFGSGSKPISTSTITVKYTGKLLNGTVFASQTTEVSAPLAQLMDGWQYALPNIPSGSQFTLYLPSGLAYGPGGYGSVPPNSNVIFEINLVAIN